MTDHGGDDRRDERAGRGTEFRIVLPARRAGPQVCGPRAPRPVGGSSQLLGRSVPRAGPRRPGFASGLARRVLCERGMTRRFLVVDDDCAMRADARVAVPRAGLSRPEAAESVTPPSPASREAEFDVVLSDIKMPGRSGIELVGRAAPPAPRDADRADDRLRQHRLGGRGDARRRLRLRHQALRARGRAVRVERAVRAPRARGGEPHAAPRASTAPARSAS